MAEPYTLRLGDCRDVLKSIPDNSVDSAVMDPPYNLVSILKRFGNASAADVQRNAVDRKTDDQGESPYSRTARGFNGQQWDTGETAFSAEFWRQVFRVLKPGGYLLAFSGTRTQHRMCCAIEDAGFDIRDQISWNFLTGFPKSHDTERAIARHQCQLGGRHYEHTLPEPGEAGDHVCMETADSVKWKGWGTALKPGWEPICLARKPLAFKTIAENVLAYGTGALNIGASMVPGDDGGLRWPPNMVHCAKASGRDRNEGLPAELANGHPTVKPTMLMRALARLVTPPGGIILDPFMGSGSTGKAAVMDGFQFIGIEREDAYMAIAQARIAAAGRAAVMPARPRAKQKQKPAAAGQGDLFT